MRALDGEQCESATNASPARRRLGVHLGSDGAESRETCIPALTSTTSTYADFVHSAVVIGPILGRTTRIVGVGRTVLDAVRATRACGGHEHESGHAAAARAAGRRARWSNRSRMALVTCCEHLTFDDTRRVYEAIRLSARRRTWAASKRPTCFRRRAAAFNSGRSDATGRRPRPGRTAIHEPICRRV